MKNFVIVYGLIAGIILGINKIVSSISMTGKSDLSDFDNTETAVLFIVLGIIIFFAIKRDRDKVKNGIISYGQVVLEGVLISLVATFIYSLVWTVFLSFVDANALFDVHVQMLLNEMIEKGASEKEIEVSVNMMSKLRVYFRYPVVRFSVSFLTGPIGPGIIISLLIGLVLKKKENLQTSPTE